MLSNAKVRLSGSTLVNSPTFTLTLCTGPALSSKPTRSRTLSRICQAITVSCILCFALQIHLNNLGYLRHQLRHLACQHATKPLTPIRACSLYADEEQFFRQEPTPLSNAQL